MTALFRIIFFPLAFIRFLLVVLLSVVFLLFLAIENAFSGKRRGFCFIVPQLWGRTMLFVIGIWTKKNRLPKTGTYLLMPNHRSYIDIFLMAAYSPSAFVAKAELLKWPILGWSLKMARVITVKRNEMRSLLGTMKKIQQSVENKIPITIFPEGTTYLGPEMGKFKSGTFKIAAELKIPIIPCAISYNDKNNAWVSDDLFINHFFRQLWKPVSLAKVKFGEPITGNDFEDLKATTRLSIEKLLDELGKQS